MSEKKKETKIFCAALTLPLMYITREYTAKAEQLIKGMADAQHQLDDLKSWHDQALEDEKAGPIERKFLLYHSKFFYWSIVRPSRHAGGVCGRFPLNMKMRIDAYESWERPLYVVAKFLDMDRILSYLWIRIFISVKIRKNISSDTDMDLVV